MKRGTTPNRVRAWKNFEREVVRELRKLAPGARRHLQFQRDHGAPDVEAGVLWVECKSGKHHRPVERVYRETAEKSAAKRRLGEKIARFMPAVVTKAGRKKVITLGFKDFLRIAGATHGERKQLWRATR